MYRQGKFMKPILVITLLLCFLANETQARQKKQVNRELSTTLVKALQDKQWRHGSPACKPSSEPAIEVFQYDESSYILRQSKCLSYEAPFIYVLVGEEKTLVLDTGATQSDEQFPIYKTILSLQNKHYQQDNKKRELLVLHSHSHSDHRSADSQFVGQENVTVVSTNNAAVKDFFSFDKWPEQQRNIDLGGRSITIIPTPGHQEEAISIYDNQTKWLLTGDTFYPGLIYVKNWQDYQQSIARLVSFTEQHHISAILGAHIESTNRAGEYYEVGTIYQPEEAPLPLMPTDLISLNDKLNSADNATEISLDAMMVKPLGFLPKLISSIVSWFI